MSQEKNEKKCSGCKSSKLVDQFYKNRLVLDGHSNYCIECTRENSKKYFQRKKERVAKSENDNLMKMVLLSNFSNESDSGNADNLMKILMNNYLYWLVVKLLVKALILKMLIWFSFVIQLKV